MGGTMMNTLMNRNKMNRNKIHNRLRCLTTVFLLILLGACATTTPVVDKRAQLVLASSKLIKIVSMENVRFGRVERFTRAQVDIRNLSGRPLKLEYQVQWRDQGGFNVNSMSAWQRITLAPRQIESVLSVGKVEEAYGIRLTVREP
jgi:uncharacterized protein YcfL